MVRHAVTSHFDNPSQRLVEDYLDKLIQVPVRVPKLGVQEVRAYMLLLFAEAAGADKDKLETLRAEFVEKLRQAWKPEADFGVEDALRVLEPSDPKALRASLDLADRMAPLLAYSANVNGNPRIIKRMLNVVRMRASVARRRKMPLDEGVIAKLALFERCTDAKALTLCTQPSTPAPAKYLSWPRWRQHVPAKTIRSTIARPTSGSTSASYATGLPWSRSWRMSTFARPSIWLAKPSPCEPRRGHCRPPVSMQ